jgi:hexosaminidase
VSPREWNNNPSIRAFMRKHRIDNGVQLQAYFNRQALKIVTKHGKKMEGWDEVLKADLPQSVVIQSWRGSDSLWKAVREGHGAILSAGYYLDLVKSAADHYSVDPLKGAPADLMPEQLKLLYGGEAAMWVEFCSAENVDSRLWPRLAAIAERFWSPASVADVASMYNRLWPVNHWLEWLNLTQQSNLKLMRQRLAGRASSESLDTFAETLEPVKGYSRHNQQYSPGTPLNRLVDAIPPESEAAQKFAAEVDEYLSGPKTPGRSTILREQLARWADSVVAVHPVLERNTLLSEDIPFADQLAKLCQSGQDAIQHLENNQPMQKTEYKPAPKQEMMIEPLKPNTPRRSRSSTSSTSIFT